MRRIIAMEMSASLVEPNRSSSLLSRRCCECQPNVRSTTHRLGSTRKPGGGSYWDQSIWSSGRSPRIQTFL
jgi:hypothetical protein